MKTTPINYSKQSINRQDVKAVLRVLRSPMLTQGPEILKFEAKLKNLTKTKFSAAVSSGTAALHSACFAIDLKKNNEVITTPLTFVATANCFVYCGAKPVFADVENHGLLDPEKVEKAITKKTRAVITVDYGGQPSYLNELKKICEKYNLYLIEDAAHSLGASYYGKPIGSIADITCFSFHPVKTITTGEGGAVATNNKKFYEKILLFRNHGITKEKDKLQNNNNPWYYEMQSLGYNFRLTEIQAALGLSQLSKITNFVKKREKIAIFYNQALSLLEKKGLIILPKTLTHTSSAWHLYPLRINFERIKYSKTELFRNFLKNGIKLQVHYIPIHLQPYYQEKFGFKVGDFPKAEEFYAQEISLPLYPQLSKKEIKKVISTVKRCLQ